MPKEQVQGSGAIAAGGFHKPGFFQLGGVGPDEPGRHHPENRVKTRMVFRNLGP